MLSFNHLINGLKILMHSSSSLMIRRYSKLGRRQRLIITIQDTYLQLVEEVIFVSVITAIRIITMALPFHFIITVSMEILIRQNKLRVT